MLSKRLHERGHHVFGFAREELRKYHRVHLMELSQSMTAGLRMLLLDHWEPSGIRTQLLSLKLRSLFVDFVFEGDDTSFHALHSVSPG